MRRDNLVTIPTPAAISGTSRAQNNSPYRSTRLTPPFNLIDTGHVGVAAPVRADSSLRPDVHYPPTSATPWCQVPVKGSAAVLR